MFIKIQGGDYVVNISQIAYVEVEEVTDEGWQEITLYMASGGELGRLTVDDPSEVQDIQKAMGL